MNEEVLGKIKNVRFGIVEGRFGLHLELSGSYSCSTSYHAWDPTTVEVTDYTEWDEDDRTKEMALVMRKVSKLLNDAKVDDVHKLNNIPVKYSFKDGILNEWRILTEVL